MVTVDSEIKFAHWMQGQIAASIDNKLGEQQDDLAQLLKRRSGFLGRFFVPTRRINEKQTDIHSTSALLANIHSDHFPDQIKYKIKTWQPWRLNNLAVEEGTSIPVRLLQGYADDRFLTWMDEKAAEAGTTTNQVAAGVAESVRKIQWETIHALANMDLATTYRLPYFIVTEYLSSPLLLLQFITGNKKAFKREIDFSFASALTNLKPQDYNAVIIEDQIQHVSQALSVITPACCLNNIVGVQTQSIIDLFDTTSDSNRYQKVIKMIIHEECHHQKFKEEEISATRKQLIILDQQAAEIWTEAETKVGLPDLVDTTLSCLPPIDELRSPFFARVKT